MVLERELDVEGLGLADFRNIIYIADRSNADDVSGISSLAGATYRPIKKTELWRHKSTSNFEGLCLGPKLADGTYSMLMVADCPTGSPQILYALKVRCGTK
jgi:hypothetical protein